MTSEKLADSSFLFLAWRTFYRYSQKQNTYGMEDYFKDCDDIWISFEGSGYINDAFHKLTLSQKWDLLEGFFSLFFERGGEAKILINNQYSFQAFTSFIVSQYEQKIEVEELSNEELKIKMK